MIWNHYGAHAWPTLMLIDPQGFLVGSTSGEGHRNDLDNAVQILLEMHGKKGTLGKPLTFRTEREKFQSGTLEFPGKVLADTKGKRLFVADTNHHRVLVSDFDGKVSMVIGEGKIGLKDGAFDSTEFHQPQGMALSEDGNTLYVADTENHAVREIDLQKKRVTTAAGTGKQAIHFEADGPGKATPLSSPWELARVGNKLYIAMAGSHQIWVMDLPGNRVGVYSGTGREAAIDGPAKTSAFAQPSGLATDGKTLYVADSEASTVRSVDLAADGAVTSLAGSKQLFGFGLKDGPGPDARFQHPLGVALGEGDHAGTLYVADTFNGVIRTIDRKSGEVKTWLGPDKSGKANGTEAKPFFEPGGLSIAGNTLYVADTNHHRIVAVDLNAKTMKVLDVTLPPAPKRSK